MNSALIPTTALTAFLFKPKMVLKLKQQQPKEIEPQILLQTLQFSTMEQRRPVAPNRKVACFKTYL